MLVICPLARGGDEFSRRETYVQRNILAWLLRYPELEEQFGRPYFGVELYLVRA